MVQYYILWYNIICLWFNQIAELSFEYSEVGCQCYLLAESATNLWFELCSENWCSYSILTNAVFLKFFTLFSSVNLLSNAFGESGTCTYIYSSKFYIWDGIVNCLLKHMNAGPGRILYNGNIKNCNAYWTTTNGLFQYWANHVHKDAIIQA